MSLSPGFLDELRSRTSLSQVVGRKVMWDQRKSNQGKGDMWSPCPFHQEKTASFHVDDRKGFYYCFGCHSKGDAISFIRETENVSFMEAVEILAREVGMPMPARDPKAQEKADRRTELAEVMEQAVQYFRLQLKTGAGSAARDYLTKRGLREEMLQQFEVGFAPDGWQNLWDHLTGKGVQPDMILACGLGKPSTKGGKPYDVFRNRIMFPIRDPRGRCIAFGGRAMDPNDNAKYLNSPETELFDKSRVLYNHGPAREAAGKGQALVVAEGYMDVIALCEAGFGAAVAPLGTAITEHHLNLLWRVAPEPIVALDGDTAGLRAAMRSIDLALPMLEAGQSLRFAMMPEGQDPDDLIRANGPAALQALLDQALPMVELLWRRETEGRVYDSPERRAALDKTLREKIKLIRDPSIRHHYGEAINELRRNLFRPERPAWQPGRSKGKGKWQTRPQVLPSTKSSALAGPGETVEHLREAVILASLISTPEVLEHFAHHLEDLDCRDHHHAALRDILLFHHGVDRTALKAEIVEKLGNAALENLLSQPHVAIAPSVRKPGNVELAQTAVAEELAKLESERGLKGEIAEAEEEIRGQAGEAVTWRLGQAAQARNDAIRSQQEDNAQYDVAPTGAVVNREEREDLDSLLEKINFTKKHR